MKAQYCKIGKTQSRFNSRLNIMKLEQRYTSFIEEAYNRKQLDASLSDFLYYEAAKLKQRILKLKKSFIKPFDVA